MARSIDSSLLSPRIRKGKATFSTALNSLGNFYLDTGELNHALENYYKAYENIKVFIMLEDGSTESVIVGKERHSKLRVGEATWVQQKFAKTDKYEANTKWSFDNV